MSQISYDEVNLMLRLYDMRREPRLRQARSWFVEHFHPQSPEDMMQKYPQSSEENTYIRMVISYWDMVASIVNRGLINDELFFESNGEIWVVWDRMRAVVPAWRAAFKNASPVWKYRRCLQAAGSLAGKAFAGQHRGHAPDDDADGREIESYIRNKRKPSAVAWRRACGSISPCGNTQGFTSPGPPLILQT